ncbi:hypothetical protein D9M69_521790 [compost metagenome]
MDAGQAADRDPVGQVHVPGQRGVVGQRRVVVDPAVVRDVRVRHDPVVVAHARDAACPGHAEVEGAELADHVAVADGQLGRLARVLLVLGNRTKRRELEDPVVAADGGAPFDHAMRTDGGARADPHMRADHGVGTDRHRGVELGLRVDDRCRMNLGHALQETMSRISC